MMKAAKRVLAVCLLVTVLLLGLDEHIVSAITSSDWQYVTVYGHTYKYQSSIWDRHFASGNTIEAVAEASIADSQPIQTGYIGVQARLYSAEDGQLKYTSNLIYSTASSITAYSDATSDSGYFYSQTKALFYNGNGYDTYIANQSPNMAVPASYMNLKYETNCNGETYGSGLLAEYLGAEPDYIAATGIGGINGYVRTKELSPIPASPDDAALMMQQRQSDRIIPLYDCSGNIIGSFIVTAVTQKDSPDEKTP